MFIVTGLVFNTSINLAFNFHSTCLIQTVDKTRVVGNVRWSRSRAPDCQSRGRWFNPTYRLSKLRKFRPPHICLCLSVFVLLSGVYARGSKRSHTGGKCGTCSGFTNSREKDNSCVSPSLGCLEVNHLRPKIVASNIQIKPQIVLN